MRLAEEKLIPDSRVWPFLNVSRDKGRRDLRDLEGRGLVTPKRSPTGRIEVSFNDLVTLAHHYGFEVET